jgi:hypothetical protein
MQSYANRSEFHKADMARQAGALEILDLVAHFSVKFVPLPAVGAVYDRALAPLG